MICGPMKTTVTREGSTKVKLEIEAQSDEVAPAIDRAFRALAGQTKIPGFRPGKAPRRVLEARLDQDTIREAVIREAVPEFYAKAMRQEELRPIADPEVEVTSYEEASGLNFTATVEVRPEIDLPTLDGLPVTRPPTEATDSEIEDQLRRLQERFATLETVERPGVNGDFALIDIRGYWNDAEIEQATAADLLYEIGSGMIVPALDTEVGGKRAGDILKFNAALPERFGEEWSGREVSFQVIVKEIRKKNIPELDDEFAKNSSEFETLAELRGSLRDRIAEIKRSASDQEVRNRALEKVIELTGVTPPATLVEEEMAYRLHRFSEGLRSVRLTLDDYLSRSGTTEDAVEADLRRQAERNVAAQLVLDEIAKREGLEATAEEVAAEIGQLAEGTGKSVAEVQKQFESAGRLGVLANDVLRRKALDVVVAKADIKDEAPSPE